MNDRELLELAAKAVNLPYLKPTECYDGSLGLEVGTNLTKTLNWNPLDDNGDSFSLLICLGLTVSIDLSGNESDVWRYQQNHISICEAHGNDPYAATRRAIVRAAAEIGKEMK